jgi:hypothetical protein
MRVVKLRDRRLWVISQPLPTCTPWDASLTASLPYAAETVSTALLSKHETPNPAPS